MRERPVLQDRARHENLRSFRDVRSVAHSANRRVHGISGMALRGLDLAPSFSCSLGRFASNAPLAIPRCDQLQRRFCINIFVLCRQAPRTSV